MVLGHEGAGIVETTGPDAKHLKEGDRGRRSACSISLTSNGY